MMWPVSGAARTELSQSHTALSRVYVLHAEKPVYTLSVVSGSVNAEAGRPVMRNLQDTTLVDPDGVLTGDDMDDLLSPYNCEVAPYRGVLLPGGTAELVPLGVFGLTSREVSSDGSIAIAGQDRAMVYQGGMSGSLAIAGGTPVEEAISRLLTTRRPGLQMRTWVTGFTCGPILYDPDIDVWEEAQTLAQSVGGWLHHDRVGDLIFAPLLPASTTPVARYAEGGGLLLDVDRAEDSDTIHNVVVVQSTNVSVGIIQAVAEDTDPTSPTFAGGRYGRRVAPPISNPHITSVQQAQQVAATELVRELGRSETARLSAVVDPTVDPLDVLVVHRPESDLVERAVVADTVETPLGVEDSMSIDCRRSILTRDGQVLDTPLELTTS